MTKSALRKYYADKRLSLSAAQRTKLDDLLLIQLQQLDIPPHVHTVLSYWPIAEKGEMNTFLFTDFMAFRMPGMQLAFPVSDFRDHSMKAMVVNDDSSFKRNSYGIGEPVDGIYAAPSDIDLVIVPLLAFDEKGYRLGYGKGFYDRYLSRCHPRVIRLGFSYFPPEAALPGVDQFDVPLSVCITPDEIYEF